MDLILIRHAQPLRVEGASGAADPELSTIGHEQARLLAAHLRHDEIDAIYASPMRRALQTAQPTADALGLDIVVDDRLAEHDQASSTYVPAEVAKAEGHNNWRSGWSRHDWPDDYEDFDVFHERVNAGVEDLISRHAGETIAVFCHAGVVARYINTILDGPPDELGFFFPLYTSVSRLVASRRGNRTVVSLNETGHLAGSGLPTGRLR